MATLLIKGLIAIDDMNLGTSTFLRSTSTGGTATLTQVDFVRQTSTSSQSLAGPFSILNSGVFSNTQMNEYDQSIVNGLSAAAELAIVQGHGNATEGISAAVAVPSSSTVFLADAVGAYITNTSTVSNAVAVYGQARIAATNAHVWGGNLIAADAPGTFSSNQLIGMEVDIDNQNVASVGEAILLAGTVQVGAAIDGMVVAKPATGKWANGLHFNLSSVTNGITFDTGATVAPSGSAAAISLNPVAAGTGQVSQGLNFVSGDPSSGQNTATINEAAGGSLQISVSKAGQGLALNGPITVYNNIATVSGGVPSELATVDLTAQTAPISATNLYTPAATGMFRINAYLKITTAGTSPVLGPLTVTYTDGTDSVAQSVVMSQQLQTGATSNTGNNGNTTTSVLTGSLVIYAKTGVAIQYAVAFTGTIGAAQYEVHLKLEAL